VLILKGIVTMEEQNQKKAKNVRENLAVCARELAAMLDVSLRQVWRLNASGKLPRPVRLGGSVRWSRQEILDWFSQQCPDRQRWEAMKEASK
jgi:prophage regulatory protein